LSAVSVQALSTTTEERALSLTLDLALIWLEAQLNCQAPLWL